MTISSSARQPHQGIRKSYFISLGVCKRFLFSALLLTVLLWLSWHALALGLANLQVLRVENTLKRFDRNAQAGNAAEFRLAFEAIDRAMALHSNNPYQLTLKARLLEWRGLSEWQSPMAPDADYRAAIKLHKKAAMLRPLWPDSWAEMANLKLRLNEVDDELDRFLAHADRLGPYMQRVHIAVVQAGMEKLRRNPFAKVPLLQKHILRGLSNTSSREAIIKLVNAYNQQVMICRWIRFSEAPVSDDELCE